MKKLSIVGLLMAVSFNGQGILMETNPVETNEEFDENVKNFLEQNKNKVLCLVFKRVVTTLEDGLEVDVKATIENAGDISVLEDGVLEEIEKDLVEQEF